MNTAPATAVAAAAQTTLSALFILCHTLGASVTGTALYLREYGADRSGSPFAM
ncbi:hypothetical protein [Ancylobacter sp. FA202]|uniref:hypothetical protein n=1 Tax=Ancylobacter sp. FA202 TaxID=1111106 RepID=UPI0003A65BDE|nr:hypothetical protein [Ancylobacter sp. FA202]